MRVNGLPAAVAKDEDISEGGLSDISARGGCGHDSIHDPGRAVNAYAQILEAAFLTFAEWMFAKICSLLRLVDESGRQHVHKVVGQNASEHNGIVPM